MNNEFVHYSAKQAINHSMSKAIGTILILYTVSKILSDSFDAFEGAATATFNTIETAALVSDVQLRTNVR